MRIRIVKRKPAPVAPKTLAEVINRLSENSAFVESKRRDLISACNSLARLAQRRPADISADVVTLRQLFSTLHPAQKGISRKRFANIRADVAAALEISGVTPPAEPIVEPSVAWRDFLDKAEAPHQAWGLARLARYCTARQINPTDVDDDVLRRFRDHLDARVVTNDPARMARDTAKNFNAILRRSDLGFTLLNASRGDRYAAIPLEMYPPSLQKDIGCYLQRLEKPDIFSARGPRRPLRPMTLRNIKAHLRQILDAALQAGHSRERFQTLADLIDTEVLNSAAEWMMARNEGVMPSSLPNILATLLAIARYHVAAPAETVERILAAKDLVTSQLGSGQRRMSPKSQRRLDQFRDEDNVARIIALPEKLMRRAMKQIGSSRAAVDATVAAAMTFLMACPAFRIANLAALNLNEDLTREEHGKRIAFVIHVAPHKTKGRQAIDAVIGQPWATVIDKYLRHHRPDLSDDGARWVFPRRSGGSRTPDHFGDMIAKAIYRETGIVMNPHLFRHLAGALFLEAHPGEYESVRRLVAYAKIETTTAFYAPQSSRSAFDRYGRVLEGRRGER